MNAIMLSTGVELRQGKIGAGLAQDLIGLAQLAVLSLQRFDPLTLLAGGAWSQTLVALDTPHPVEQRLRCATDLRRDRTDRRPLGEIFVTMLEHHPNRALAHLRRKLRSIPGLVHCSILSKERASGKPGAVHWKADDAVIDRQVTRQQDERNRRQRDG
jgi:hypothetical protein